jgi:nicotinamidase-related amidase
MPATLVVVDMQPQFKASNIPNVIVGVTREILDAKRRKSGIIFLEYTPTESLGRTHDGFSSLIRGYRAKARVTKKNDDGSKQVVDALRRRGFASHTLRICGVNTECCVAATVNGLVERLDKTRIEVVKDACESEWERDYDWRSFIKHPRIKLI